MKSQVDALLLVTSGIITDIKMAYPALDGLDLDLENLTRLSQTRGIGLFTLDLPNLDACLLAGLEEGRLRLSGSLTRRVSKKVRVPRFFSGLWLRVFDCNACLRLEPDVTAIFFLRQLCCLGKKIAIECSLDRTIATVREYHDIERRLREPSERWELDDVNFEDGADRRHIGDACFQSHSFLPLFKGSSSQEEEFRKEWDFRSFLNKVQQVADLISYSITELDPLEFSGELESQGLGIGLKHGPGAVAERLKQHEKSCFPNWPLKLQRVFPFELMGKTIGSDSSRPHNHEVSSRLIAVPKTAKAPRLIAAEPTSHQWCQQLVWRFLKQEVRRNEFLGPFINFSKQQLSGELVLKSSRDGSLATVDLSSASDRLTCWTVERIFRKNPSLLSTLHAVRTRYIRDDISDVQSFLKAKKFASQGAATTFPVQSIVFCILALACSIQGPVTSGSIKKLRGQVRVFGDDIIIPAHGYARLVSLMEYLQLKVNVSKSYAHGRFRESCGVDAYLGYDVTPVKPSTLVADDPASCQAVIDTSNNLYLKGLWHASNSLLHMLPPRLRRGIRIVGLHDSGFSGLTSFSGSDESHLVKRWNSRLHRDEVRVWTLSVQTQTRDRSGWETLLDFFTNVHNPEHARVVHESVHSRKTRGGLRWEPLNTGARLHS